MTRIRDIVENHAPNKALTPGHMHQIVAELKGRYFRQVLMLGNREYLRLGQLAQGEAILKSQHRVASSQRLRA